MVAVSIHLGWLPSLCRITHNSIVDRLVALLKLFVGSTHINVPYSTWIINFSKFNDRTTSI